MSYGGSEIPVALSVKDSPRERMTLGAGLVLLATLGASVVYLFSTAIGPRSSAGATVAARAATEAAAWPTKLEREPSGTQEPTTNEAPQHSLITTKEVTIRAKAKHGRHRIGGKR